MARLEWNKPGERLFEVGVDRVVLFPPSGVGVAWGGVTSIEETSSGGEMTSYYFEGVKYLDLVGSTDFDATLTAFNAPVEFRQCEGSRQLAPGLFATNQPHRRFNLTYRTRIGNDLLGTQYGYKIHFVYNATAGVANRSAQTIAETVSPTTKSWTIKTVPPPATEFKPTAHFVLDSTNVDPEKLADLEDAIYGKPGMDPYFPTQTNILEHLNGVVV